MPLNMNILYSGVKVCRCVKKRQNCDPHPSQVLSLEFGMSRVTFLTYTSISSPLILSLPTPGWSSYPSSSTEPSVSFTLAFWNQGTRPKTSILLHRIQQYRERVVETGQSLQGDKLTMCSRILIISQPHRGQENIAVFTNLQGLTYFFIY